MLRHQAHIGQLRDRRAGLVPSVNAKGKTVCHVRHEGNAGEAYVQLQSFLTLSPYTGQRSGSLPRSPTAGKRTTPICTEEKAGWDPQPVRTIPRGEKSIFSMPGIKPRKVQSKANVFLIELWAERLSYHSTHCKETR
jgi:hypothetical protein